MPKNYYSNDSRREAKREALDHAGHDVVPWDCGCSFGCGLCEHTHWCNTCRHAIYLNPND